MGVKGRVSHVHKEGFLIKGELMTPLAGLHSEMMLVRLNDYLMVRLTILIKSLRKL